ncbi:MAG: BrnA antitoxin family protein [Erysipelotrichaceae bacterium]|nr:BrnA antitoxin family protein [Erysipelotrichaceae bacterium]
MAVTKKKINLNTPLTDEQKKILEKAASMPAVFDDDSPELTEEQLKEFRRISDINRQERRKQTVTIRLSPQALKKAKSLGKGYTSILSRILENAWNDTELIRKSL